VFANDFLDAPGAVQSIFHQERAARCGGSFGGGLVLFVFNFILGSLIGGFVLLWQLIMAAWYVPLTVLRLIRLL